LLERVTTLTERLTELLSDRNQASIAAILENVQEISRSVAERSPEIAATLAEGADRGAAGRRRPPKSSRLADSSEPLLNQEGRPLVNDLRHTIRAARAEPCRRRRRDGRRCAGRACRRSSMPGTIPEPGQLVRDLRETAEAAARCDSAASSGKARFHPRAASSCTL
jgi:phospholipid/cholesterol/gamma-HCH transport system substrate-binding protein